MFELLEISKTNKQDFYRELFRQTVAMLDGETDYIAQSANLCSLIWHSLPNVNWTGFYFYKDQDNELVLGPFQGKPACVRITPGKGVCGTAFTARKSLRVDDVYSFQGHIFCDPDSRSEIVIPLLYKSHCIGVLDIDSPITNRFNEKDQQGLEAIVDLFIKNIVYP